MASNRAISRCNIGRNLDCYFDKLTKLVMSKSAKFQDVR